MNPQSHASDTPESPEPPWEHPHRDAPTSMASRSVNAYERIQLARDALIATGYFAPDEVSDDIAPRITELWNALTREDAADQDEEASDDYAQEQGAPLVDARCAHPGCSTRTYEMIGTCGNCGAAPLRILFTAGHEKGYARCPTCECRTVRTEHLPLAARYLTSTRETPA